MILRKMMEIDRPDVPKTRVLDTSDGPNRPPGGSRAFQRLRKAAPLPHGFAIWQDRAPYASKWRPRLGMGSSFQKWCCGLGQGTVWSVQASKAPRRAKKRPEILSEQYTNDVNRSESDQLAPWPLIQQRMKERRLQAVSSLVVYWHTCRQAAAYMSTKKTAEAEQQVNSNHAEWESADILCHCHLMPISIQVIVFDAHWHE